MSLSKFTLVELLVVVAIIMVLAGLLLPSLKMGRDRATQIVCLGRMKQLHTAFMMYAQDNNERLPPGTWDGSGGWTRWMTRNIAGQYWGNKSTGSSDSTRLSHCPAYKSAGSPGDYTGIGYNMSVGVDCAGTRLTAFTNACKTVLLVDTGGNCRWGGGWAYDPATGYGQGPGYRHSGGANVLFVDGHGMWVKNLLKEYESGRLTHAVR